MASEKSGHPHNNCERFYSQRLKPATLSPRKDMKISSFLDVTKLKPFKRRRLKKMEDPFSLYYEEKAEVFCIGKIPLRIKQEARSIIKGKLTNDIQFNRDYVNSLDLSSEGKEIFDSALSQLSFWISKLVGMKKRRKGQSLYPWQYAVIIVPSLSFNAWVRLSYDEKDNTAMIFLNVGVLLENLDRLHATFSTPGFLEEFWSGKAPIEKPLEIKQGYLCNLSENQVFRAMATEISIKAAMFVVFHELAHFLRGHVSYLRGELDHSGEIHEAPTSNTEEVLDNTTRRVMEVDADQMAGIFASQFWRQFDHPAVSPKEFRNEAFSLEVMSAILSNNLILGQYEFSDKYYSPIWRTQHILEFFYKDFFYVDETLPLLERQNRREKISRDMYKLQLELMSEHERSYKIMGWGKGLSTERLEKETDSLLGDDQLAFNRLIPVLAKYMPPNFFYQRPDGQEQY